MSGGMDEQTRDEPSPQAIAVASAAQLVDAVQETFGPLGREVTNLRAETRLTPDPTMSSAGLSRVEH